MSSSERNIRRSFSGKVLKKSSDKTISVLRETLKRHSLYSKVYKVSKKYLVHDENNETKEGDIVTVVSCRPLSKNKKWRVSSVQK